jgi:MFS family permease
VAELLGMAVWFSASAVVPALTDAWKLDESGRAWLTMSVQGGFVVGALGSALLNVADRVPARLLFALSALLAGVATALIPLLATGLAVALPLRFLTGAKEDRGLAIWLLVAATTLGSAAPHLLNAFGGVGEWQAVLYGAAALAALGGLIAWLFVREGPYRSATPRFNWRYVGEILREREIVLANLGYLGHMWELFCSPASFRSASIPGGRASSLFPSSALARWAVS